MTSTVAKMVKKFSSSDKAAFSALSQYVAAYRANRGLTASTPRVSPAMMGELNGWPVRNSDGGGNIAHFSSYDSARIAVVAVGQVFGS